MCKCHRYVQMWQWDHKMDKIAFSQWGFSCSNSQYRSEKKKRPMFGPVSVFSRLSGHCEGNTPFPRGVWKLLSKFILDVDRSGNLWAGKEGRKKKKKKSGCRATSHRAEASLFLPFWQFLPLPADLFSTKNLCIPAFLNLYLSITPTDSSDNSDLEDDIILSLNEWGAFGVEDRGTRRRVKPSAS